MSKNKKPQQPANNTKSNTSSPQVSVQQAEILANTGVSPFFVQRMPWLFFVLAFLLYAPTIGHQYAFDDSIVIVDNQFTQKGLAGIKDLLTRDFFEGIYGEGGMNLSGGRYRPLSLLMFAIEYQFFGPNPTVGHFINVLLFAFTAFLVFKVLLRWFGEDSIIPMVATLLFVVHPIHTEVVANIKSRDEILALLLVLVSFRCLHRLADIRAGKMLWAVLAGLAFFGAMLSKESAFTFIVLMPLALWVFDKQNFGNATILSAPLFAAALGYLMLRTAMLGLGGTSVPQTDLMENPLYGTSTSQHLGTVAVYVLYYWKLLFVPYPLSSDYSFNQIPIVEMSSVLAIISTAVHISLLAFVLWKLPKKHPLSWVVLGILAPLSPASNLFFNIGAPMGERFLYLSSFAFCVGIGYGVSFLFKGISVAQALRRPAIIGVLLLIALAGSALSFQRNKDWYNNETLFAADVKTVPNSAKIHYYYANTLMKKYLALKPQEQEKQKQKLLPEIEKGMARALEIYPQFHHACYNLGLVYYQKPDAQKALEYWNKTQEIMPNHILSLQMLAELHARYLNQPDKSIEYCRKLTEEAKITNQPTIWQTMGISYSMKADYPKAIECLKKATELNPKNPEPWHNMGAVYGMMGDAAKAKEYTDKANSLRK